MFFSVRKHVVGIEKIVVVFVVGITVKHIFVNVYVIVFDIVYVIVFVIFFDIVFIIFVVIENQVINVLNGVVCHNLVCLLVCLVRFCK